MAISDTIPAFALAARLAHSNAISVLPVPVLYIIEPLKSFLIQLQPPPDPFRLNGNFRYLITGGPYQVFHPQRL
jgi:hypothetical protein